MLILAAVVSAYSCSDWACFTSSVKLSTWVSSCLIAIAKFVLSFPKPFYRSRSSFLRARSFSVSRWISTCNSRSPLVYFCSACAFNYSQLAFSCSICTLSCSFVALSCSLYILSWSLSSFSALACSFNVSASPFPVYCSFSAFSSWSCARSKSASDASPFCFMVFN